MNKKPLNKGIACGIILIFFVVSIFPANADFLENCQITKILKYDNSDSEIEEVLDEPLNYLGKISVMWSTPLVGGRLKPYVECENEDEKVFEFPEVNGSINLNFTVIYEQGLGADCILPRFTQFRTAIYVDGYYIYNEPTALLRCTETPNAIEWQINASLETNGETKILTVYFRISGFICFIPWPKELGGDEEKCTFQVIVNPV